MFSAFNPGNSTVIDSRTFTRFLTVPEGLSTGYSGRPYDTHPYGGVGYAKPRARKVYPRHEWAERIKDRERQKALLSNLWQYHKLPVLNQQQTNYCWVNGVVGAVHMMRAFANLPFVYLSPASCASRIKGFQNVGGWGGEAIEGINKGYLSSAELWPQNAIDRRYDTEESRANARLHMVLEWDELRPQSFDELISSLIDGFPCPVGHSWWGHLVCHVDPLVLGRDDFGTRFANSWGDDWEDHGFGVMHEEKATPDEGNALRVVMASAA